MTGKDKFMRRKPKNTNIPHVIKGLERSPFPSTYFLTPEYQTPTERISVPSTNQPRRLNSAHQRSVPQLPHKGQIVSNSYCFAKMQS
jgi:hypothetical protein